MSLTRPLTPDVTASLLRALKFEQKYGGTQSIMTATGPNKHATEFANVKFHYLDNSKNVRPREQLVRIAKNIEAPKPLRVQAYIFLCRFNNRRNDAAIIERYCWEAQDLCDLIEEEGEKHTANRLRLEIWYMRNVSAASKDPKYIGDKGDKRKKGSSEEGGEGVSEITSVRDEASNGGTSDDEDLGDSASHSEALDNGSIHDSRTDGEVLDSDALDHEVWVDEVLNRDAMEEH